MKNPSYGSQIPIQKQAKRKAIPGQPAGKAIDTPNCRNERHKIDSFQLDCASQTKSRPDQAKDYNKKTPQKIDSVSSAFCPLQLQQIRRPTPSLVRRSRHGLPQQMTPAGSNGSSKLPNRKRVDSSVFLVLTSDREVTATDDEADEFIHANKSTFYTPSLTRFFIGW